MTQARSLLVPANAHGIYHCVSRCVRRAWLCGRDPLTGADHEHRRQWVEDRLAQLADLYAVSIWAYAVMSNHLHVVIEMHADIARTRSPDEIAVRWLGLYPPEDGQYEVATAQIVGNSDRLGVLRSRLCSLSWFMKSLSEPIARRANVEDHCKGRFWEGRFRSQVLLDETAVLSAMTYVDLNPIRAGMTAHLEGSFHTSILKRIRAFESAAQSSSPTIASDVGRAAGDLAHTLVLAPPSSALSHPIPAGSAVSWCFRSTACLAVGVFSAKPL